MEIRCSSCGHIGPAAQIMPGPQGVELICANCGHANLLVVGGAASPQAPPPSPSAPAASPQDEVAQILAPAPAPKPSPRPAPKPADAESLITPAFVERLVPTPGDGLRCPKCAHLVRADEEHCSRCGLNQDDAARFPQGQAPWEVAPRGKEDAWERATLMWRSAVESWDQERVDKFVELVKAEGLHELGVRKLRFFLVETPDDPLALAALQDVAAVMQARLLVARNQANLDKQAFEQDVTRLRGLLMIGSLVFWGLIMVLFLGLFMKNCG